MEQKRIVCIGDSITDAFMTSTNDSCLPLGAGYPMMLAAWSALNNDLFEVINRGISGNQVPDLYARWESDVLKLCPAVLSILIGVNDVWHEFQSGRGTSPERFSATYRLLLDETRRELPECRILLLEPFSLPIGVVPSFMPLWQERMAVIQECVRNLADEKNCIFVNLQNVFTRAADTSSAQTWLADGVHPTGAGHALIARELLKVL